MSREQRPGRPLTVVPSFPRAAVPSHVQASLFFPSPLQLGFDMDREVYPLVVHAVVDEGDGRGSFCLLLHVCCPSVALTWQKLWHQSTAAALYALSPQQPGHMGRGGLHMHPADGSPV